MPKRTILAVAVLLLGTVVVMTTQRVRAENGEHFNPLQPFGTADVSGTGMLGVVPGQTLRLNAVNIGVLANACSVQMMILDASGNHLTRPDTVTLLPGAAAHLDFSPPPSGALSRTQARTLIALAETSRTNCAILPTVEVFDNVTQRTSIAMSGDPSW